MSAEEQEANAATKKLVQDLAKTWHNTSDAIADLSTAQANHLQKLHPPQGNSNDPTDYSDPDALSADFQVFWDKADGTDEEMHLDLAQILRKNKKRGRQMWRKLVSLSKSKTIADKQKLNTFSKVYQ